MACRLGELSLIIVALLGEGRGRLRKGVILRVENLLSHIRKGKYKYIQ